MINLILIFGTGILEGIWRRIFGGWLSVPRWLEHVINIVLIGSILFFMEINWLLIVGIIIILQTLYWGQGHGAFFDLGHHGKPDAAMLERYKRAWGYTLACKIFPEEKWYTYWFDTFLMFIRYTIPALMLIPFTSWLMGFGGIGVTISYMLGWYLQDNGCRFLGDKLKGLCSSSTNFGELLGGFITGVILIICLI